MNLLNMSKPNSNNISVQTGSKPKNNTYLNLIEFEDINLPNIQVNCCKIGFKPDQVSDADTQNLKLRDVYLLKNLLKDKPKDLIK